MAASYSQGVVLSLIDFSYCICNFARYRQSRCKQQVVGQRQLIAIKRTATEVSEDEMEFFVARRSKTYTARTGAYCAFIVIVTQYGP